MKLRSVLLGSLFAAFGAVHVLAADASIVFEPEPRKVVSGRDPQIAVRASRELFLLKVEGKNLWLHASFDGGDSFEEPVRVNGVDEPNLLEVVPLPGVGEGAALVLSARRPMEVAVAGLRKLPPSAGAETPDSNLRPVECCIGCNGYIVCGLCVEAECGVCCVF